MKILILNGNPEAKNKDFDQYLNLLADELSQDKNEVQLITIRDKKVLHCMGCWDCWVKTPGECRFDDDSTVIRESYINSDMVIFASPLIMGFISSIMKKVMDRMIPLLHPYIEIVRKEAHHSKRYDKYPLIGLLYQNNTNNSSDSSKKADAEITTDIFNRFALNFRTDLAFSFSIETEILDVINEIDSY